MKSLQIDFAPRRTWLEVGTDKRRRPLWALACALMLILLAASLTTAWKLQRERSAVNTRVAALQAELQVGEENDAQKESLSADSAQSVQVANQFLNYPWVSMIGALERNIQPKITLLSVDLGVQRQSSRIVIEAADVGAALSFVETMRDEPAYASLMLMRQEKGAGDSGAMRFTLEAPIAQPEDATGKVGGQ